MTILSFTVIKSILSDKEQKEGTIRYRIRYSQSSLSFSFWPFNQQPLYSLLEFAIIFSFCFFFQVWNLFWTHKMNWVYKINLDTFFFLCPGLFKNTEIVCSLKVRQDLAEKLTDSVVPFKQLIFGYIPNVCYKHWSVQVLYFFLCQLRSFVLY